MILDPKNDGIEVFYSNKLRNLTGALEECTHWILEVSLCEYKDFDKEEIDKDLKDRYAHIVFFKNKKYVQFKEDKFYLDFNGIGVMWLKHFENIGLKVEKLDVKRVKL